MMKYWTCTLRRRDSMTGFTQEDPIKDGLNWYSYVANNPVMFVDPWGQKYKPANEIDSMSAAGVDTWGNIKSIWNKYSGAQINPNILDKFPAMQIVIPEDWNETQIVNFLVRYLRELEAIDEYFNQVYKKIYPHWDSYGTEYRQLLISQIPERLLLSDHELAMHMTLEERIKAKDIYCRQVLYQVGSVMHMK